MPYYIGKKPKRKRRRPSAHNRKIKVGKGRTRKRNVLVNPHIKKITKKQYNRIRKLNPNKDYDRDGVKNKDDCYPFDEKRHGPLGTLKEELDAYSMYRYGKYFKDLTPQLKKYVRKRVKVLDKYVPR